MPISFTEFFERGSGIVYGTGKLFGEGWLYGLGPDDDDSWTRPSWVATEQFSEDFENADWPRTGYTEDVISITDDIEGVW